MDKTNIENNRINPLLQLLRFLQYFYFNDQHGLNEGHLSMYLYLLLLNNYLGWNRKYFSITRRKVMQDLHMSNFNTYTNRLKKLNDLNIIDYLPGSNALKPARIKIRPFNKNNNIPGHPFGFVDIDRIKFDTQDDTVPDTIH